ncbi:shikimate kinase [Alistipes sp.]|uniref:shikimate kinase n=1 Tax=Alistipes sp. TaxID=1872444 RepID=UPI003A8A4061
MGLLFLVGYMGCGKSTLGRKLARRLGVPFVDTDALIEQREGASVSDVFRYEGEQRFREVEREVLEQAIAEHESAVVSTGGGLPVWRDNMACMNAAGCTVYLCRTAENIAGRLSPYGRRKRPRLQGLDDHELVVFMTRDMAERDPFYRLAKRTIECDGRSDDEIVEWILACGATDAMEGSDNRKE